MEALDDFAADDGHVVYVDSTSDALTEFDAEDASSEAVANPLRLSTVLRRAVPWSGALVAMAVAAVFATTAVMRPPVVRLPSLAPAFARPSPAPPSVAAVEGMPPAPLHPATASLAGAWRLTSRVGDTNLPRYRGLVLGYVLTLEQDGSRLRGTGVKWTESGRALPPSARTPISVEGAVGDGALRLAFTENGLRRTSHGTFTLRLAGDGSMAGSFRSDAADSSGSVTVMRAD